MSILVNQDTRVICQGITGKAGAFHTKHCLAYGTRMVGGVTPGKGGGTVEGVPVFDTVVEAVEKTGANATMIYVPAAFTADAILEALDAGIEVIVAITEGVPVLDMVRVYDVVRRSGVHADRSQLPGRDHGRRVQDRHHARLHPPARPRGRDEPQRHADLRSRLADDQLGLGQTTCVGLGGDPIVGTSFIDLLKLFEADDETEAILMIGEIGGTAEEEAAAYVQQHVTKPVAAFIAGRTAPPGKRMGHAGAIISGGKGTAEEKIAALQQANIEVAESPADMGAAVQRALGRG
jgi:succinyl-CoA synthetase alpha subunit